MRVAPSTMLRMVPLPRCAEEEPNIRKASNAFALGAGVEA